MSFARSTRFLSILGVVAAALLAPWPQAGAQGGPYTFYIPVSQLTPRQDAIIATLKGTVPAGGVGPLHDLKSDADLHFALNAPAVETPVVAEMMNCKLNRPEGSSVSYWRTRFLALFAGAQEVTIRGVFRIWPDHPVGTTASNPGHLLEIHPVTSVTAGGEEIDLRGHVAPMELEGREYPYKAWTRWSQVADRQIRTERVTRNGRMYLAITTNELGYNYWRLKARSTHIPVTHYNGTRFTVRILKEGGGEHPRPVRCFTIAGSPADLDATSMLPDTEATLLAIGRLDLRTVLGQTTYAGPMPIELCVFGINTPDLPDATSSIPD